MRNFVRHLLEELNFKKKKYRKGEVCYCEWSTRIWHLKHCGIGYTYNCCFQKWSFLKRLKYFITGYQ